MSKPTIFTISEVNYENNYEVTFDSDSPFVTATKFVSMAYLFPLRHFTLRGYGVIVECDTVDGFVSNLEKEKLIRKLQEIIRLEEFLIDEI